MLAALGGELAGPFGGRRGGVPTGVRLTEAVEVADSADGLRRAAVGAQWQPLAQLARPSAAPRPNRLPRMNTLGE